jgi:hypothetical protein
MDIESLILFLSHNVMVNNMTTWDFNLVSSFSDQISQGKALTQKQANIAVKILKKHVIAMSSALSKDIMPYLNTPVFRYPIRIANSTKKISIAQHKDHGKIIKVEFPFDDSIITKIRSAKSQLNLSIWDAEEKYWIFSVDAKNIDFLSVLGTEKKFEFCEEFANYAEQVEEIKKNVEKYVPMVVIENEKYKFINIPPSVPQLDSKNLTESLFLARKLGIFTWSDAVEQQLQSIDIDPLVRKFLKYDTKDHFILSLEENTVYCLKKLLKYLTPCIFFIPGGREFDVTEQVIDILRSMDIKEEEISVLFRLPSEHGKEFNDYVRENGLNSPLTAKTRAVLISQKIPKPVIESKIHFHCVVNFSNFQTHYSSRDFLNTQSNIIEVWDKTPKSNVLKEINFWEL